MVLVLLGLLAARDAAGESRPALVGQWVWCDADRRHFVEARELLPSLVPGVWVSTIGAAGGHVTHRLALPPGFVEAPRGIALVVRFDDSFHVLWSSPDPTAMRADVAAKLAWLLAQTETMGVRVREVHLDYDCPTRRLPEWAGLVRELAHGVLRGRTVWITSLPAHMKIAEYGDRFRDAVAGHILQVFDLGPALAPSAASRLARLAASQRMPFRLGLGAFERVQPDGPDAMPVRVTDHGGWFDQLDAFAETAGFAGVWVFPAGMRWAVR